ncbi:MAG: hypothetical protein NC918_00340 [Candidatus Omnitrophica bacterium]|nr:hypothetical protein [Candidatus Omnitrophota bacterium]
MKFKYLFIFLLFLFLEVIYSEFFIQLLEPVNGAYTNNTHLGFYFTIKDIKNSDNNSQENNFYDPKNISCFIFFQYEGRILKKGPLYLPIEEKGLFEFKTMPYGNYIWWVNCLNVSSEFRVLIVGNKSFEKFLEEMEKQKSQNEDQNKTLSNQTQNNQINQTKNESDLVDKTQKDISEDKKQNLVYQNFLNFEFLILSLIGVILLLLVVRFALKEKKKVENKDD